MAAIPPTEDVQGARDRVAMAAIPPTEDVQGARDRVAMAAYLAGSHVEPAQASVLLQLRTAQALERIACALETLAANAPEPQPGPALPHEILDIARDHGLHPAVEHG